MIMIQRREKKNGVFGSWQCEIITGGVVKQVPAEVVANFLRDDEWISHVERKSVDGKLIEEVTYHPLEERMEKREQEPEYCEQ